MRGDPTAPTIEAPVTDEAREAETRTTPFISVVIPCLNEAQSIAEAVRRARQALRENGYEGEVVVADNGSTDGSPELAEQAGARVVHEKRRGYGSAYLADSPQPRASTSSWPTRT